MTLSALAGQARKLGGLEVSASGLHNLETGNTKKRPSREKLRGLALALNLSPMETQSLLEAAGYRIVPGSFLDRACAAVQRALNDAESEDAEIFVHQIESLSDRFVRSLVAREDDVRYAMVPIAGWQARALAPEIVERSLEPALNEIVRAGIDEVTLVTAPGAATRWRLQTGFRQLHLRIVEQEQASGLGHALLKGRPPNYLGPVAVLLPDEVDRKGEALGTLVQLYRTAHTTIVGVHRSPAEKERFEILRYYGIAVLKKRGHVGQSPGLHRLDMPLIEKPQQPQVFPEHSRKIAGRYILTANIFESMASSGTELTTALNTAWESLMVHEFSKSLLSLSPYQGILDIVNALKVPE